MYRYRPLRAAILCYEALRLLCMAAFFAGAEGVGRYYLGANGLFLLAALSLLTNPSAARHCIPLYGAGKAIALVLPLAGAIAALSGLADGALPFAGGAGVYQLIAAFFVWCADALTLALCPLLARGLKREEPRECA
ncbi:MAG: hypothetical protein LBR16_06250 [Treponema sp.]|jgi:hypothetical protein|nr:hypothetical protein [Treponema sp.]